MKKKKFCTALGFLAVFVIWTAALRLIDVQAIGPQGSAVGFATLNGMVHRLTGVHMQLYIMTDWLSLVPVAFGLGFAWLGLTQWIKRKSIRKVDRSILILGAFYLVTLAAYVFFERYAVNYRPVLIEGYLEASYPSSTTLLVLCVMPTAMMQLRGRIKNRALRQAVTGAIISFTVFMVAGRLVSGVHWLTDIIGGILLGTGLVMTYDSLIGGKIHE
ncbi:MAG: phosphatase PAP2 family protein [Clostridia bacterium]|nr:phosphatase PAP2 family protein [Clostridia bacterium]